MESSILFVTSHLSISSTLPARCDMSRRHERPDLLGDLARPEDDALDEDTFGVSVDQDVEGRPTHVKLREQFGSDHDLVAYVTPLIVPFVFGGHQHDVKTGEILETRLREVPTPVTIRFNGDHERQTVKGPLYWLTGEGRTMKGPGCGPWSLSVEGTHLGGLGNDLYVATVPTPATGHRIDRPRDDFRFFDRQVAAHGVVMEGTH